VNYQISRDGKIIGSYSYSQITNGLISGTFKETDYFWKTGMSEWKRLAVFNQLESEKSNPTPTKPVTNVSSVKSDVEDDSFSPEERKTLIIGYALTMVSVLLPHIEAPQMLISNIPTFGVRGTTYFIPTLADRPYEALALLLFAGEQIYKITKQTEKKFAFIVLIIFCAVEFISIRNIIKTMDIPITSSDPYGRLGEMMAKSMVTVSYGIGFYIFSIGVAIVAHTSLNRHFNKPSAS
jgi:GYF domain 2